MKSLRKNKKMRSNKKRTIRKRSSVKRYNRTSVKRHNRIRSYRKISKINRSKRIKNSKKKKIHYGGMRLFRRSSAPITKKPPLKKDPEIKIDTPNFIDLFNKYGITDKNEITKFCLGIIKAPKIVILNTEDIKGAFKYHFGEEISDDDFEKLYKYIKYIYNRLCKQIGYNCKLFNGKINKSQYKNFDFIFGKYTGSTTSDLRRVTKEYPYVNTDGDNTDDNNTDDEDD